MRLYPRGKFVAEVGGSVDSDMQQRVQREMLRLAHQGRANMGKASRIHQAAGGKTVSAARLILHNGLTIRGWKPPLYTVLLFVSAMAPKVRPWYPPRMAMMFCLPVIARAILTAASTASEPEFQKKNESKDECGIIGKSRSMSCRYGVVNPMLH